MKYQVDIVETGMSTRAIVVTIEADSELEAIAAVNKEDWDYIIDWEIYDEEFDIEERSIEAVRNV